MSPLLLLLTAITVVLIGAVFTSVVNGNANLDRARIADNEHVERAAARRTVKPPQSGRGRGAHDRSGRRQEEGAAAPRPAIGAGEKTENPVVWQGNHAPESDLPPLGTPIRLENGRTGSVDAYEQVAGATRAHVRLDGGGRGHIDIPDTARPAARPQPVPAPRPAPAVPVPAQAPAPAPAPAAAAKPVASNTTVRLGGFSVLTPGRRS
jgi:hypothetical protein